jgi:hypothetical protein
VEILFAILKVLSIIGIAYGVSNLVVRRKLKNIQEVYISRIEPDKGYIFFMGDIPTEYLDSLKEGMDEYFENYHIMLVGANPPKNILEFGGDS